LLLNNQGFQRGLINKVNWKPILKDQALKEGFWGGLKRNWNKITLTLRTTIKVEVFKPFLINELMGREILKGSE